MNKSDREAGLLYTYLMKQNIFKLGFIFKAVFVIFLFDYGNSILVVETLER